MINGEPNPEATSPVAIERPQDRRMGFIIDAVGTLRKADEAEGAAREKEGVKALSQAIDAKLAVVGEDENDPLVDTLLHRSVDVAYGSRDTDTALGIAAMVIVNPTPATAIKAEVIATLLGTRELSDTQRKKIELILGEAKEVMRRKDLPQSTEQKVVTPLEPARPDVVDTSPQKLTEVRAELQTVQAESWSKYDYLFRTDSMQTKLAALKERAGSTDGIPAFRVDESQFSNVGRLGGGAYADVYAAIDANGQQVAVKVAKSGLSERDRRTYDEEAVVLRQLAEYQRAHNLTVNGQTVTPDFLGTGTTDNGRDFFVTPVADGVPLGSIVRSDSREEQRVITVGETIAIASQHLGALEALHSMGMSKHDFQVQDMFWDRATGKVTEIDWNLLAPLTLKNGDMVPYSPQEDLYTTAKLILFRLAARKQYDEKKDINDQLESIPEESGLRPILAKALSQKGEERYADAQSFRKDLEELVAA